MQPVFTAAQSRAFDKYLIEEIGIPSLVHMENAARGVVESITDWLEEAAEIVVLCGPGNNGGDGLAIARLILHSGKIPTVFLAATPDKLSRDARVQYDILSKLLDPGEIYQFESAEEIIELTDTADLVIDALLGTGSSGAPTGLIAEAVKAIGALRSEGANIVAVDFPTGLNADVGIYETDYSIVKADRTVTMAAPKIGFYRGNAGEYAGEISIATLGAPIGDYEAQGERAYLVEREDAMVRLPRYSSTDSKISRGTMFAVCGSRGMTGAAILSATAALRSGCGLVNVGVPASERSLVAQAMPELLTAGLAEQADGSPDISAWDDMQEFLKRADALLIGCGLRPLPGTAELLRKLITDIDKPMVIDAGGIGSLVGHLDLLKKRKAPTILTPHVGELARLVDRPWQEVEKERIEVARDIANKYGVIVVAKGAQTYTVDTDKTVYINSTGNPGLATAGTGDVLAGMIVSLVAQNQGTTIDAAICAVYLHGLAGDLAAKEKTQHGMTATDLMHMLPNAFKEMGLQ
jgi:hydroxyethylthiazole kinase-like uncharacterized protein yjeF